ncbi:hypothetical protein [Treponema paraluiscuniculi]|uniref:hypothetical protein n=1 Tax=Treponema paraluiscuniculi TaxID=53435 RepID=UPI002FDBA699
MPAALLPIQLITNMPGKEADYGSSIRDPADHVGYLNGVPGSWLWPGPDMLQSFGE